MSKEVELCHTFDINMMFVNFANFFANREKKKTTLQATLLLLLQKYTKYRKDM